MKFLKEDMKRAFCNPGFWIAAAVLLAIFFHAIRINTNFEMDVSTYEIILNAMALSGFTPFAAIFPSMGYAIAFCEEYRSGYTEMILSRMNRKKYIRIRMLTVGTAGGAVIAIPIAAVCLAGYLLGVHGVPENGLYQGTCIQFYLERYGDAYVLIGKVILGFLFGAMWALAALAFAAWSANRYVALIAPFLLYEAMWMLFYHVQVLNPIYLVRGDDLNSYPLSGAMELFYIGLAAFTAWLGMKRRLQYE